MAYGVGAYAELPYASGPRATGADVFPWISDIQGADATGLAIGDGFNEFTSKTGTLTYDTDITLAGSSVIHSIAAGTTSFGTCTFTERTTVYGKHHFYFDTSLPTADTILLAGYDSGDTLAFSVTYDQSAVDLVDSEGNILYGTPAADTWYQIIWSYSSGSYTITVYDAAATSLGTSTDDHLLTDNLAYVDMGADTATTPTAVINSTLHSINATAGYLPTNYTGSAIGPPSLPSIPNLPSLGPIDRRDWYL